MWGCRPGASWNTYLEYGPPEEQNGKELVWVIIETAFRNMLPSEASASDRALLLLPDRIKKR